MADPDMWQTDGGMWWANLNDLGPANGDGRKLLADVRKAGGVPWLVGGFFGIEQPPGGLEPPLLKRVWAEGAALAAAMAAELAGVKPPVLQPLKYVSADVNRRVQVVGKKCVTNTFTFARDTGKEHKGLIRAIQAVREDFPQWRHWFVPQRWRPDGRPADGRVVHYDVTLHGWMLAIRERLENQPNIDFDKEKWISRLTKAHREAEAGRVIWFLRDRLELPMALASDGHTVLIDTRGNDDAIPPVFRPRLISYGAEIADLLRRNGLFEWPRRQLALDFNVHRKWDDVIRDAWGHR